MRSLNKSKAALFEGFHNTNLDTARQRLSRGNSYRDLSTVWVCPCRDEQPPRGIPPRIVSSFMGLMRPMNQKVVGPLFIEGMEVGDAYNQAVETILANPELSKYKYMLTVEEDNAPPADGLVMLYESMKTYDVVGGLYWTKGELGQPMIYGDPKEMPKNFLPQMPLKDTVQECNGLGMGFTLFKLSMFKKLAPPWFKSVQEIVPYKGAQSYTQDLWFFQNAGREGFRFACDTRVKVGHFDRDARMMW